MCKNSIPANADNKVVAGENAKSVYVVTVVEQETTDIEGVYDNFDSAKSHFANLKEWIREFWEDDYEESPEDIRINYDSDTYYEVYNECQCVKIILEIVEKKVENSYNPIIKDMTQLTVRPDAETGKTTAEQEKYEMKDKNMNIGCFDMYYEEFENVKDGQYVIFADCANGQLLIGEVDRCGFDDLDYAIAIRDAHSFEYGVEVSVYLVKKGVDEYGVVTNELIKCVG